MTNTDVFIKTDENVSNNKINEFEKIVDDFSKGNKCTVTKVKGNKCNVTKVNDVFPCDTCKSEINNRNLLKNHIMTNPDISNNKINESGSKISCNSKCYT